MITQEHSEDVVILRMDHGKANALDLELMNSLIEQLDTLHAHDGGVVLTGTGTIFSAGVDLFRILEKDQEYAERFLAALSEGFRRLWTFPRPVVAVLNGHAVAGGCVLACACDYRVAAEGPYKMGITEISVGVPFPSTALEIMRSVLAPGDFQRLVLGGALMDLAAARELGLVDELCPADRVLERGVAQAALFSNTPAQTWSLTKREIRAPYLARCSHATDREVAALWMSGAVRDSLRAYRERTLRKSKPGT